MRKLITILLFNVAATATVAQDNFTELPTNVNGINLGSAEWVDYDGDGLLDIFITGFKIGDDDIDNGTIFRNLGDGTFEVVNITNITRIIYGDQDWGGAGGAAATLPPDQQLRPQAGDGRCWGVHSGGRSTAGGADRRSVQ